MDRFMWSEGILSFDEQHICEQNGVRLYDGDNKSAFDHGKLQLTSHHLVWRHNTEQKCILSLSLALVVFVEEQPGTFTKSSKIIVHLSPAPASRVPGPLTSSSYNYIMLSFKEGGQDQLFQFLQDALQKRMWEIRPKPTPVAGSSKQLRTGIGGIERNIQKKNEVVDKNIVAAFEDLSKLMEQAKIMVNLSKNISEKIRDKQGDISEDETVRFKSYLLSLGVSDPVTRETHGSGQVYYQELARQVAKVMQQPLQDCGGVMTLPDVYCWVNRARGMELLSPEDLVNASRLMESLQLPVKLRVFATGVMVLLLTTHDEAQTSAQATHMVSERGSLSAEELSKLIGVSVILSKERLFAAENMGSLCRDETIEGLRFYPNRFLLES